MNLLDVNANIASLRPLTSIKRPYRQKSSSTHTKSASSSSASSAKLHETNPIPVLIQLCLYPDEKYAYRTMSSLFKSMHRYSPNITDEFGCNVLMYALRYQRYQLFELLLRETSIDLDFWAKDRQGNTLLHYAIVYAGQQTHIFDLLIDGWIHGEPTTFWKNFSWAVSQCGNDGA